ncbi:unnamed protein product [Caenorhabditis angaria]|uniref:Seven TM Receptor n=1 Tax=Caenorhabditis angaria TaxID=860376 RepID=A0A9P1IWI4_9PELO|nr:unnamed protein product [Caenorhabditis angaria]
MGIVFTFLDLVIQPTMYSYHAGFTYFSETFSHKKIFSKNIQYLICSSYSAMHCSTMAFIAVQFLFRYWALISSEKLRWFDGYRLYIWVGYSILMGVLWDIAASSTVANDEFGIDYFRDKLSEVYASNIDDLPVYTVVAYENEKLRINALICTVCLLSLLFIQYAIVIFCAIRMKMVIKENLPKFSKSQRKLQKQFYIALMIQISAPSLIIHFPILPLFLLPFFNFQSVDLETSFLISTFSAYPLIDTLIILLVIGEYKEAIRNMLIVP